MSKRPHTPPRTSSPLSDDSTTRTPKAARSASRAPRLYCNLPPTCHAPHPPTPLADIRALESHYATYHAHVCEVSGCACVFPDARLLELHQTECHDPMAELRRERGEKIFGCHLPSCGRVFSTPKTRRLHLISAHGFPKEYFFAVTNKGVAGLLRRWGEGASLLRGNWKPRGDVGGENEDEDDGEEDDAESMDAEPAVSHGIMPGPTAHAHAANDQDVDALASGMTSLSLVPSSVRFGRGGKSGGLAAPRGRPHAHTPPAAKTQDEKHTPLGRRDPAQTNARGRGASRARGGGRGRGGFVPPPPRGGYLGVGAGRPIGLGIGRESRGRGRGRGMV